MIYRVYISQVVQDFFHQQHHTHTSWGAKWRLPGNTWPFHCQSFTGSETGDVQRETLILVDFLQTFDSLKFGDYVRILTLH